MAFHFFSGPVMFPRYANALNVLQRSALVLHVDLNVFRFLLQLQPVTSAEPQSFLPATVNMPVFAFQHG